MSQPVLYSRRKLLYGVGLGGVALAIPSLTAPLAAATSPTPLDSALAKAQAAAQQAGLGAWSAFVGKTFTIMNGASSIPVTLVSLTLMPSTGPRPAGLRPAAIAATFAGTNGPAFPAGNQSYTFKQPNGVPFQLFVNPKTVNGTTAQLVAILN